MAKTAVPDSSKQVSLKTHALYAYMLCVKLLLFIVLMEYCSSLCLFANVYSSLNTYTPMTMCVVLQSLRRCASSLQTSISRPSNSNSSELKPTFQQPMNGRHSGSFLKKETRSACVVAGAVLVR